MKYAFYAMWMGASSYLIRSGVFFAWWGWPGVARRQLTFFCFAKIK